MYRGHRGPARAFAVIAVSAALASPLAVPGSCHASQSGDRARPRAAARIELFHPELGKAPGGAGQLKLATVRDAETFYYRALPGRARAAYRAVSRCVLAHGRRAPLPHGTGDEELSLAIDAFLLDHPEAFWLEPSCLARRERDGTLSLYIPRYSHGKSESAALAEKFEERAGEALDGAGGAGLSKMRRAMDYLADRNEFSEGCPDSQTMASALGDGGASVCAGYSMALCHIARKAGIPAIYVRGHVLEDGEEGERHAWVAARIGHGIRYYDPSWYDRSRDGAAGGRQWLAATAGRFAKSRVPSMGVEPVAGER